MLVAATTAFAQDPLVPRLRRARRGRHPAALLKTGDFDGAFQFCRMMYRRCARISAGSAGAPTIPTPRSIFSIRLSELTKTRVSRSGPNEPNHFVVRPTDEALYQCPFIIMSDPGSAGFSDDDAEALRSYLLKGGFLWADDYWGPWAWDDFAREIAKVLPPAQYPIRELTFDHPIFKTMFTVTKIPQVPSWQYWSGSGDTSEMGTAARRRTWPRSPMPTAGSWC